MKVLLVVNDVDMTPYINEKSYKVNSKPQYESWQDGNFVEHRVIVRNRVEGSFEIAVYGYQGMDYQTFLDNWNAAVDNGVVTIGIYVMDQNKVKAIQAYYDFTGERHYEKLDGTFFDIVTVNITER